MNICLFSTFFFQNSFSPETREQCRTFYTVALKVQACATVC